MKKRVLSGIRASGRLHLGNYFGMVKEMLELSENPELDVFFMVADLHATTTPFDPAVLRENVHEIVLDYLSAGLDSQKASVFIQSHVPVHTELAFLFSSAVTVARMQHLPTFKDKVKQYPENVTMALLNYPVLQAADILAYKTSELPVGDDQLSHIEVAREIARKMNDIYGLDFPEPKQLKTQGHYIPSLTGEGKMSKSVEGSYINLTDELDTIADRLASVPTDSGRGDIKEGMFFSVESMKGANGNGEMVPSKGVESLMTFVELFQGKAKRKDYEIQYEDKGVMYGELKDNLAKAIYRELEPIQERRKRFENDSKLVEDILREGAEKARKVAQKTVGEVKTAMGLI